MGTSLLYASRCFRDRMRLNGSPSN